MPSAQDCAVRNCSSESIRSSSMSRASTTASTGFSSAHFLPSSTQTVADGQHLSSGTSHHGDRGRLLTWTHDLAPVVCHSSCPCEEMGHDRRELTTCTCYDLLVARDRHDVENGANHVHN